MNNQISVTGAEPFKIEAHSFMISASGQGYTLEYSADGEIFTAWDEPIASGINLPVINCPRGCWWKCTGNEDVLTVSL